MYYLVYQIKIDAHFMKSNLILADTKTLLYQSVSGIPKFISKSSKRTSEKKSRRKITKNHFRAKNVWGLFCVGPLKGIIYLLGVRLFSIQKKKLSKNTNFLALLFHLHRSLSLFFHYFPPFFFSKGPYDTQVRCAKSFVS